MAHRDRTSAVQLACVSPKIGFYAARRADTYLAGAERTALRTVALELDAWLGEGGDVEGTNFDTPPDDTVMVIGTGGRRGDRRASCSPTSTSRR